MSRNFELMQHVVRQDETGASTRQLSASTAHTGASIRTGVEAFFRQWRLFFSVSAVVILLTCVVTFLTKKQYASEVKFLVQNARENVIVTPERTNPSSVVSEVTESQVNSELEILHSHDVIDQVADPAWESLPPAARTASAIREHERLLTSFNKRFGTEVIRKTNIIQASIVADSPGQATQEMEQLSAAYLAEHRNLQRPAGASEFFASEAKRVHDQWDGAVRVLASFQSEHQLLSVPDREASLDEEIADGERDLFTADSALSETDAQLANASRKLQEMPSRVMTQEKVSPNQMSSEQLETLLVDLKNKRTSLLTNYKPSDRSVKELDQEIATASSALNEVMTVPTHEQTTDVDPAWQQVHTAYVQDQIARQGLLEHQTQLKSHLDQLKSHLEALQQSNVQFNSLQSQADELKDNYELYVQKRDQAQIEDAMDEHKLLNVAVAQQPTVSFSPVRPRPLINALLGTITALFVGFCAVYFAETSRDTVATPRELDSASRYPVLATVPFLSVLSEPLRSNEGLGGGSYAGSRSLGSL